MKTSLQCKILSLDLWDTIVRRRCHPDEIKAMTAEYVCMRYGDCISDVWRNYIRWSYMDCTGRFKGDVM